MRRSDIFESFVKIAEEKGLISKGTPEENIADLSKTHRADSLSIDDINHLYGVKPPAPKDAQYERNIAEVAHPNPTVLTNSYDKLNSLVENVNERQDILLHIVNKNNTGSIVQTKYAERELVLSLVRVGNDMDNRGQDELRKLADVCLRQVGPKSFQKQAQAKMILALIGAIIGGIYAKQHLRFHSDGFAADYEKAIKELDDLLNSNSNLGVGYDYKPEFLELVNDIKNKLATLNTAYQAVLPQLDKLYTPHTGAELAQMANQQSSHEALHALQEFKKVVDEVSPFLQKVITDFGNEGYKQLQIEHKGFLSNLVDSAEILHGGKGFIADDFDDVAHALETIQYDVQGIQKSLVDADAKANQFYQEAQQTTEDSAAPAPVMAPVHTTPVKEDETAQLEKELAENPDLEGALPL